jgi:hypothetical protein
MFGQLEINMYNMQVYHEREKNEDVMRRQIQ